MSWLLDTNIISEWTKPSPAAEVIDWLDAQLESSLFLSVITFAELRRGTALLPAGKKRQALASWLEGPLAARFEGRVLSIDLAICEAWGELLATAHRKGIGLHVMDGFVAATAQVHGLTLVSRNTRDFESLDVDVFNPFR